ncbi:MAG: metalloregulator ArsR/SmtB family transcription factor [Candidatus Bipolaricaulota bacterium]|nr:winged helix-turn-helix transcriptional regulator [Candidatus Bipolaricaulota bacterium]MBS3792091.1 winged helix-turn-helix transcriptional regulator [Candidatus Bipolaricaulota bacterium]
MSPKSQEDYTNLHSISEDEARELVKRVPDQESVDSISETFRALSEPTRVKILYLLASEEMCVHDLTTLTDSSQSSVSHHLKILKLNDLVEARREGKAVYYSLVDQHVSGLFSKCLEHVEYEE